MTACPAQTPKAPSPARGSCAKTKGWMRRGSPLLRGCLPPSLAPIGEKQVTLSEAKMTQGVPRGLSLNPPNTGLWWTQLHRQFITCQLEGCYLPRAGPQGRTGQRSQFLPVATQCLEMEEEPFPAGAAPCGGRRAFCQPEKVASAEGPLHPTPQQALPSLHL